MTDTVPVEVVMVQATAWIAVAVGVWLLLIGAAVGVTVRVLRALRTRTPADGLPSPLAILERRYAAGEIDGKQFHEAVAELHRSQIDV